MSNSNDETDWTDDADLAVIEQQMLVIDSWLADRDPRALVSPPPRGSLSPYQRRKMRESLRRALQPIHRRIGDLAEEALVAKGDTWIIQLTKEQEAEFADLTERFVEISLAHGYTKREGKMTDLQQALRDLISAARAYAELTLEAPECLTLVLMTGVSTADADADTVDDALRSISDRHHLMHVRLMEELLENAQEQ